MNPRGEGKRKYASLALGSLLSLSLFLNPLFAEEKDVNVRFARKDYNVSFDEQKFLYKIEPDAEYQVKKEVLASAIIDDNVNEIKKKKQVLEDKIDEFLYENPSEMDLFTAYKDIDFKIAHESPFNIDSPILDIVAERKGNELSCDVKLSSYKSVMRWDKRASVIISYPKDTSIIRLPDKVHEIDVNSTDMYGRYKTRDVTFSDEKEVLGFGFELLFETLKQTVKDSYGITALLPFSPVEFEKWLEKNERRRRDKKTKSMVQDRNWRQYQPQGDVQSKFEAGRKFSLQFKGKPERIDFFVNSNLYQNPLNPTKEATTLNNESIMLKVISVFIDEPTEKTTAGQLIKLGWTIDERVEEFIGEYENKKLHNLDEKELFYHKIKLWDAQIYPFVTLLEGVKDRELKGSLDNIPEYNKYIQNVNGIQKAIMPLQSILIKYNEKKSRTNARDTLQFLKEIANAIDCYGTKNGKYPADLEILVVKGYLKELKNDEWGNEIIYNKRTSENKDWAYELRSAGKDGKFGNWAENGDDVALGKGKEP